MAVSGEESDGLQGLARAADAAGAGLVEAALAGASSWLA